MAELQIPDMSELRFEEAAHAYFLNGKEIPSVSKVMEPLSNYEYGNVDENVLKRAAYKGTAVHNAIENYLKYGIDDLEPDYRGYLEGFMGWWNYQKPEYVASEIRTYHRILGYAGTADLLALIDGRLYLVDFKTTSRLVEKNCRVQLEAYAQALKSHGIEIAGKKIVRMSKDGKWEAPEYDVKDGEAWRVFGSLQCLYNYMIAK